MTEKDLKVDITVKVKKERLTDKSKPFLVKANSTGKLKADVDIYLPKPNRRST